MVPLLTGLPAPISHLRSFFLDSDQNATTTNIAQAHHASFNFPELVCIRLLQNDHDCTHIYSVQ